MNASLIFEGLYTNYKAIFEVAFELLKDTPGAVAEFGVYDGHMTRILASSGREIYAFDTFEGIPASTYDPVLDSYNPPGKFKPRPSTEAALTAYPNIHIIKGLFVDTLPTIPEDLKFVVVYVDCDHYLSHKQVLAWLPKHLMEGSVVLFDDYNACPGAHKAVDEFMELYKLGGVPLDLVGDKLIVWPKL